MDNYSRRCRAAVRPRSHSPTNPIYSPSRIYIYIVLSPPSLCPFAWALKRDGEKSPPVGYPARALRRKFNTQVEPSLSTELAFPSRRLRKGDSFHGTQIQTAACSSAGRPIGAIRATFKESARHTCITHRRARARARIPAPVVCYVRTRRGNVLRASNWDIVPLNERKINPRQGGNYVVHVAYIRVRGSRYPPAIRANLYRDKHVVDTRHRARFV